MSKVAAQQKQQQPFLNDILEIRRRAREHIEQGAVTDGYKADRVTVLRVSSASMAQHSPA